MSATDASFPVAIKPVEAVVVAETVAQVVAEPVVEPASVIEPEIVTPAAQAEPVAQPVVTAAETEPVAQPTVAESENAGVPASDPIDAFAAASRTFRAVADDERPEPATDASEESLPDEAVHVVRRRPQIRKFVTIGATVGVMSLAGLLAVGMTMPAEAVAAAGTSATSSISLVASASGPSEADADEKIQAFVTSSEVQNDSLAVAENFSTVSLVDLASEQGIKFSDSVFTNDPEAAIQWPFMVGVSMSSGYGPRWGTMHQGIDFTPGEGAPIQAIADGTVRIATEQGGGYGVTVYIDHVIDGKVITSHYAHMQYGSLKVKAGDTVKVGDIVGLTGNTGHSFGAHLHFELIVNGSTIDPLPWLRANAGRYTLD